MITREKVFKIGHITRVRGLRGEVEMQFTDDCFDTGRAEYFVLDMDGILVPFFWEEYRFKNNDTLIVRFEHTDTEEKGRALTGHDVYYPKHCVRREDGEEGAALSSYRALTGWSVSLADGTALGEVSAVDDSSQNILLTILTPTGKELLVPFHNDFLADFDLTERTLSLDLPQGLLELNE